MLFIIIVLTLAYIIISYFVQNCRFFSSRVVNSLPGPIRLPLIDLLNTMIWLCEKYSSPLQMWVGPKSLVMIYEPDQIKTVLHSRLCLDKSMMYKIMEPIFGTGLLTAPVSIWTENRKTVAPTFNASMMRKFFDLFVQESLIFTKELEKIEQCGNEIIFLEHLERCTIRISCDSMMGVKIKSNTIDKCWEAIEKMKDIMRCRFQNVFLTFDFIFNLTSLRRKQQEVLNFAHSFVTEILQQRINKPSTVTANGDIAHKRFFDIFMSSSYNGRLTQKEIVDNVLTMILTSSDTIAVTMHFVVFMLANFFEIQEKVYKELSEIYGTETPKSSPVKYEDLQHMHYLDCVIKETLRLFPTVPIIGRQLTEDLEIENIVLPKGTDIIMSFIRMNRNEKYWPKPLMFDPDRFLPGKAKNHKLHYYMPFSDGPRNCIGMKYAMMSMKVILATLIRTFVFKVNQSIEIDKIKLNMDIVLSTVEPLKIRIEKRNL